MDNKYRFSQREVGTVFHPVKLPSIHIHLPSSVYVNAGKLNRMKYGPHLSLVQNCICYPLILLLLPWATTCNNGLKPVQTTGRKTHMSQTVNEEGDSCQPIQYQLPREGALITTPDESTILNKKQPRRNKECEEERTTAGGC